MKAEEFVRSKFVASHVDSYKGNGPFGERHYLCWSNHGTGKQSLGEGSTASKAWTDAKRNILESEKANQ